MTTSTETPSAEITYKGFLEMQVCVPKKWTDENVTDFAESENSCGTQNGWCIRTDKKLLAGDPVRNKCSERKDFVHLMLDA